MKNPDTQFLRAVAILLVINSHLDRYYPMQHIGTGGAIGNSIFFFLSAFGLYLSQQKQSQYFKEWFTNRISRIYPSLWIVLISLFYTCSDLAGQVILQYNNKSHRLLFKSAVLVSSGPSGLLFTGIPSM